MKRVAACVLLAASLSACGRDEPDQTGAAAGPDAAIPAGADTQVAQQIADAPAAGVGTGRATARMRDSQGRDLGEVVLTETAQGIQLAGQLRGLAAGERAIHLHQTGRCEAPSFESAGDHWNPTNAQHGFDVSGGPHMGDMRNITVAADSTVALNTTTPGGGLRGANGLIDNDGGAVVIHAKADDYRTQPSGDAGDRIACGVVEMGT